MANTTPASDVQRRHLQAVDRVGVSSSLQQQPRHLLAVTCGAAAATALLPPRTRCQLQRGERYALAPSLTSLQQQHLPAAVESQ